MGNRTPAPATIGERIRQLRLQRKPSMTQREVAERAGVSVDLISKLEQGVKHTALLTSLHKIARALDVDVAVLLAQRERMDRIDVASGQDDDQDGGVLAIRRAIIDLWEDGAPVTVEELTREARYAWSAYWASRVDLLGSMIPSFITAARATARAKPSPLVHAAVSDAYGVAGSVLVQLGHNDLAFLAMERALAAADRSEDQLRRAAVAGWTSWLLMHQTGTLDQARRLALAEADQVEPRLRNARPEQLAVWGGLLLSAGVAAARNDRAAEADDIINLAESAAVRLNGNEREVRIDHDRPFGVPVVIQVAVDASVVTDRAARALELAKRMPPDAALPAATRARHLTDVAAAQTALGRDTQATDTLLEIERQAPAFMRYQAYPRVIVRELLERERRARTPRLRALAVRLNVA